MLETFDQILLKYAGYTPDYSKSGEEQVIEFYAEMVKMVPRMCHFDLQLFSTFGNIEGAVATICRGWAKHHGDYVERSIEIHAYAFGEDVTWVITLASDVTKEVRPGETLDTSFMEPDRDWVLTFEGPTGTVVVNRPEDVPEHLR